MRRTVPAVALLAALTAVVAAEKSAPDPAKLVAALGSPAFADREAAARALDALGEPALPALKKALAESDDPELTERAEDLFARITRRAENARLIAPTLVELNLADAPAVDALAALEKQTGYKFYLPTDTAPAARAKKVTVRTNGKVAFWEAADAVCAAAGLRVVGTGLPQADPRYRAEMQLQQMQQIERLGGRAPARVPAPAGFVPAVPDAPAGGAQADDADEKKLAEKMAEKAAAGAKAAKELEGFWGAIEKKAEQAVQQKAAPKADEKKPAPAPAPLAPPAMNPAQQRALLGALATARTAPAPVVSSPFAVLLAPPPPKAPALPASSTNAVRVEVLPSVADYRAGFPDDTLLALLQATPEPKLGLEQVTEVRVTRAVADTGRELVANKLSPPGYQAGGMHQELILRKQVVLQQRLVVVNGMVVESSSPTNAPGVRQGLVKLKAADGPVTKLSELSGVLVGLVRTPPAEVVAVPDLYPKGQPAAYRGHAGSLLRAVVTDENIDDTYTLDVTVSYPQTRVSAAAPNPTDEALVFRVLEQNRPAGTAKFPQTYGFLLGGLAVTDDAGRPFKLTLVTSAMPRGINPIRGAERLYTRSFRLTATPTGTDQGKPARVGFYGTWQKSVEVPFTLKDVPVAAGAMKR